MCVYVHLVYAGARVCDGECVIGGVGAFGWGVFLCVGETVHTIVRIYA